MGKIKKRKERGEEKAVDPKQQKNLRIQKLTTYTGAGVVVLLLLIVAGVVLLNQPAPVNFELGSQPVLGDPNAPVKIIEFADFKCPGCKSFHDRTFTQLKSEYIDTGKVAFYFVNFPVPNATGVDSPNAAYAAECLYHEDNSLFWSFYDKIFANQPPEREPWALPDNLMQLIKDLEIHPSMDEEALRSCIVNKTYEGEVARDTEIGREAGVGGTPSIFVNGKYVPNYNYESVKTLIDEELGG